MHTNVPLSRHTLSALWLSQRPLSETEAELVVPQMRPGVGRKLAPRECERITAKAGAAYQTHTRTDTAPAPRLEVMTMRKEIAQWNPSHWTDTKLRRFLKHVRRESVLAMSDLVGPYQAGLLGAELLARLYDLQNAALLAAAGVKTLGDGGSDDSQPKA